MREFGVLNETGFDYLGISIPSFCRYEQGQLCALRLTNFTNVFTYIDSVLQCRDNLKHNLLGHMLNTKAFIGSKLMYTFSMAPSPPSTLHTMVQRRINNYVWSGGFHAVNAKLMYQPWDTGGMFLYSGINQEESLKLKWFNKLVQSQEEFWQVHIRQGFALPIDFLSQLNCTFTTLLSFLKPNARLPIMWKDIFRIWCKHNCRKGPGDPSRQLLCGNVNIRSACVRNAKLMLEFYEHGICTVQDFLDHRNELNYNKTMQHKIIIIWNAIPSYWKENDQYSSNLLWDIDMSRTLSVSAINKAILKNTVPTKNIVWTRWEEELGIQHMDCDWKGIIGRRLHISQIKMRTFYVRFAFRAYATNNRLMLMGIWEDNNCSFCGIEQETRLHLFWECPKVSPVWGKLITFCKRHIDANADYCRNNCLLLGFEKPVLNLVMTLCKHSIHCARIYNRSSVEYIAVLRKIRSARIYEHLAAKTLTRLSIAKTSKYWGNLMNTEPFSVLGD